mmetsp:Transcript_26717/g.49164  ORF Transcript_26717/g.49164 Transcript_26717/m.49164 type:complete len:95 (+) Transcript_26717:2-286(+)
MAPCLTLTNVSQQGIAEALSFQKEVLDLRRCICGPEQSEALMTLSEYADVLCELGTKAREDSLKRDVVRLASRLAKACGELGMDIEAERLNNKA